MAEKIGVSRMTISYLETGAATPNATMEAADEVDALPLDAFGDQALILKVWAGILGQDIWFISGEAQVQILQERGVSRGEIFTARELTDLLKLFERDAEKARLVLEAKRLFEGAIRKVEGEKDGQDRP